MLPTRILAAFFLAATLSAQPGTITKRSLLLNGAPSAVDPSGNVYATTYAPANGVLQPTAGAAQTQPGGGGYCLYTPGGPAPCTDAYIVKTDASGNTVFATFLGGPTEDGANAIAIDPSGSVYVTGSTGGSFPTTPNAAIPSSTTSTAFAAKLSPDGSKFVYVTYLPDNISTEAKIFADPQGNAYITGQTTTKHIYVIKLSPDGSTIVYNTLLAGSNQESAGAVVADSSGNAFVTGSTNSPDFPVTAGVVQPRLAGAQNAFVTKLDPSGAIVFSNFLGGSAQDAGTAIQADANGNTYIVGSAQSLNFPTTAGTIQPAPLVPLWSQTPLGFIAKLAPDASSLVYSTYLPSSAYALALGATGDVYLAGGAGPGFPVTASAPQPCVAGNFDEAGGDVLLHLNTNGALLDATNTPGILVPSALTIASDGSIFLAADSLFQIRFGGSGWTAPACMTLSVLSSATFNVTRVVPGQLVSLAGFGIGPQTAVSASASAEGTPTTLGGVQVFFDGKPAPISYAQSQQVNVQAPFELAGQTATTVTLQYSNTTFGPIPAQVQFASPGLFRLQPGVSAQAYAVNQDGTLNSPSNPASGGSIVALWGTGFGSTSPACPTGGLNAPGPVNIEPDLAVQIDYGAGTVQYAGGAPTLPCGVFQINMQVPTGKPAGALVVSPVVSINNGETFVDSNVGSIIYIK